MRAWNLLPGHIVTSPTLACFKHRLAKLNLRAVFLICYLNLYFMAPVSAVLYCLCVLSTHSLYCYVTFCFFCVANIFD